MPLHRAAQRSAERGPRISSVHFSRSFLGFGAIAVASTHHGRPPVKRPGSTNRSPPPRRCLKTNGVSLAMDDNRDLFALRHAARKENQTANVDRMWTVVRWRMVAEDDPAKGASFNLVALRGIK